MTRWNVTAGLFVVVGLLLLTNQLWLFPHEGEDRYTYQRLPIEVENGTLTYNISHCSTPCHLNSRYNDLNAIACQPRETHYGQTVRRDCLFDEYLVTNGPIRLAERGRAHAEPRFVRLDDTYYRRIYRSNTDSTVTVDVERVSPRDLLGAVAENFTGVSATAFSHYENRLVVTGGTTTTSDEPADRNLGNVYYRNGTYYTLVFINRNVVNNVPGRIRPWQRLVLTAIGGLLVISVVWLLVYPVAVLEPDA